jgi:Ca2+-binding RTX toxin-like protein
MRKLLPAAASAVVIAIAIVVAAMSSGAGTDTTAAAGYNLNPPVAVADSYTVAPGGTLTVAAPGVLANDTDADNDTLTAALATGPTSGSLALQPDGSFTYTPTATNVSNAATVTITISNVAPVAKDDAYSVIGGGTLMVPAPGVLGNDTDPNGDTLTAVLVNDVSSGTLALNPNGSFTYTPGEDTSGPVTFTYRASDGTSTSNLATVTIAVTAGCDGRAATIVGTPGADNLTGTSGNDVIVGRGGNDVIDGGSGSDVICGGSGEDRIAGGSGNDRLFGGSGADNLQGGSGDDLLDGGAGDDVLDGGGDNDRLLGGDGADRLRGGGDPDVLDGGPGAPDRCDGEGGSDSTTGGCEAIVSIP